MNFKTILTRSKNAWEKTCAWVKVNASMHLWERRLKSERPLGAQLVTKLNRTRSDDLHNFICRGKMKNVVL
jgi:hypothetical protein